MKLVLIRREYRIVRRVCNFVLESMNFARKSMDFSLKTMDLVLKTMDFALKTTDFAHKREGARTIPNRVVMREAAVGGGGFRYPSSRTCSRTRVLSLEWRGVALSAVMGATRAQKQGERWYVV